MKNHTAIIITAIICLTLLQIVAMLCGINGTLRALIVGIIAALAGLVTPSKRFLKI